MTTLAEQTQQAVTDFIASLPEASQQTVMEAMQRLMSSDVGEQAKQVGEKAPDFSLPNAKGGTSQLSALLQEGPVVVSFYRGGWCPFCNLEFKALHDVVDEINAMGANLIGVAPETLDNTIKTTQQHQLKFDALSDEGNIIAREYGLLMAVDEAVQPLYIEWGINVPEANGDDSYELPVPATYVIDTQGVIRAAHIDKDYTKRMEPTAIVAALKAISG